MALDIKDKTVQGTTSATKKATPTSLGSVGSALIPEAVPAGTKQTQVSTPSYNINYEDQRFKDVEADKQKALDESNAMYDQMIGSADDFYQKQIDAANNYAQQQKQFQQEQTDLQIKQIEQQREKTQQDYIKEQQGAYVDWQKQSDQYGAAAEQMAASGLMGSGYSESSQVAVYTAYQNRLATAREAVNQANLNYDNAIQQARLANSSAQAEIAYNTLKTQLELSLEGFQHENDLLLQQLNTQREIDSEYNDRWLTVWEQMQRENEFSESVRQFNESMKLEAEQMSIAQKQWQAEYDFGVKQFEESIRQYEEEMKRLKAQDKKENELKIKQLEQQKKEAEQQKKQWEAEMKEKKRQFDKSLEEEKRQFNQSLKKASGSSSSSATNKSTSGSSSTTNKGATTVASSSGTTGKTTPTTAQKKSYSTFQTNIGNLMIKNPSESAIANMEDQLKTAAKNGKITEAQYRELLDLLY